MRSWRVPTQTWCTPTSGPAWGRRRKRNDKEQIFRPYQVNAKLFGRAKPDAIFLHCLPAHRGDEVTDEVIDSPRSFVFQQAENRLHAQKAIMLELMSDKSADAIAGRGSPGRNAGVGEVGTLALQASRGTLVGRLKTGGRDTRSTPTSSKCDMPPGRGLMYVEDCVGCGWRQLADSRGRKGNHRRTTGEHPPDRRGDRGSHPPGLPPGHHARQWAAGGRAVAALGAGVGCRLQPDAGCVRRGQPGRDRIPAGAIAAQ